MLKDGIEGLRLAVRPDGCGGSVSWVGAGDSRCCNMPFCGGILLGLYLPVISNCTEGLGESSTAISFTGGIS